MGSVRDQILNELFFPRVVLIDSPGVIMSKTVGKYGLPGAAKRILFDFEDTFSYLHVDTAARIGRKRASALWYRIGKQVGFAYISLSGAKRIPEFLKGPTIQFVFKTLARSGASGFNDVEYQPRTKNITLAGRDNVYCRITKDPSIAEGLAAGLMSSILGMNVEGRSECSGCPDGCRIVCSPDFPIIYVPPRQSAEIARPAPASQPGGFDMGRRYSFSDLIRFRKVIIDEMGRHYFRGRLIMPTSAALIDIVLGNYQDAGLEDLAMASINRRMKVTLASILPEGERRHSMQDFMGILSAFGWGQFFPGGDEGNPFAYAFDTPFQGESLTYLAAVLGSANEYMNRRRYPVWAIRHDSPSRIRISFSGSNT